MTYSFEWSQIGLESNCIYHDSQMTKPRCERFAKKFWASYGRKIWKIGVRRDGNACVQQVLINGWVSGRRSQARQLCRVSVFWHLLNNYQQRASLSPWGLPCPVSGRACSREAPVTLCCFARCSDSRRERMFYIEVHIMNTWKGRKWSLCLYLRTILFSVATANVGWQT